MSAAGEHENVGRQNAAAPVKPRLMRKVAAIPEPIYGVREPVQILFEPSRQDIQHALDNNQLEDRGFQSHLNALTDEWNRECNGDAIEFYRLQKIYHARRIAYLVKNGWEGYPIEVTEQGAMNDGTHRLKAAKFKGMDEVEITIHRPVTPPAPPASG